jgi:transcriptional antiterminator RfaH
VDGLSHIGNEENARWYVVHTHAHAEETAKRNLVQQGFTAFLPQYAKKRRHARKTETVRAPLFPRYLFVAIDVARARWRTISSTIGVQHLICHGEAPVPVPNGVIDDIRARADEKGLVPVTQDIPFKKGDVVQVTSGALAQQVGLFDCASDEERVFLLLDMLGRQVRIKVPLDTVAQFA